MDSKFQYDDIVRYCGKYYTVKGIHLHDSLSNPYIYGLVLVDAPLTNYDPSKHLLVREALLESVSYADQYVLRVLFRPPGSD